MAAPAQMRPLRRSGQYSTPSQKAGVTGNTFSKGVPVSLSNAAGNMIEFSGTRAANRTTGRVAGISEQGVSAGLILTGSGSGNFPNIDFTYVPAIPGLTFKGTLSNAALTRALVATDVGSTFGLTKDAPSTLWFLDSAKVTDGASGTGNTCCVVVALIDPVGATASDTPSPGNSGTSLVEFTFLPEATAYSGV